MFKALLLEEKDGKVVPRMAELAEDALPAGDVTVAVEHSTLNYKDGLILQGLGRLVRQYPHVPGIDFAGRVLSSENSRLARRRSGRAHRLAGRRGPLGRLFPEGAGQGRLAGEAACGAHHATGHGDRHGGIHGHAGGDGAGGSWPQARQGRDAGDRGGGRGRERGHGHPRQARLSGRGLDGATRDP